MPSPSLLDIASNTVLSKTDVPAVSAPAAKLTLLICDDEEGPRQSLRIVFKNDYQVLCASSGPEAITLAKKQPVDIAVLDIMMHGMTGVELLKHLKEINPSTEVVMLTAYETLETARQALRLGASDYLNKPFDIPMMRAAVARAAQKHTATHDLKRGNDELRKLQQEIQDQRVKEEMARTKGEIYASVLHDINSPLTVISGFIELINKTVETNSRLEGEALTNIREDLRSITGQVDRCFDISRRYLSFLEGGPKKQSTRTSVRQILVDVNDLLLRHPAASSHDLRVAELQTEIFAEINGTDLLQILLNLTINALQATDLPHEVEVMADFLPDGVSAQFLEEGPGTRVINADGFINRPPLVVIRVRDTGPGIPAELVPRMFEEHFTTKAPGRGTGLGLSIVKRLLKEAGGAIRLETKLGAGTQFTLLLPASA